MKETVRHAGLQRDPWDKLKQYTSARIALGRSGSSIPTSEWLTFKLSHARARDAVHVAFDVDAIKSGIESLGMEVLIVESQACDRGSYLKRPDLGRRLSRASEEILSARADDYDLVIIVSDGLSALAVHSQTLPLLGALLPRLNREQWRLAPVVVARFGRVALQDQIGSLLNARMALILLGERPGLGSPDSLGAYLVFSPRPGNTDANRNCVSNIRGGGLQPTAAANTLHYLLSEARRRQISGIALKDERPASPVGEIAAGD